MKSNTTNEFLVSWYFGMWLFIYLFFYNYFRLCWAHKWKLISKNSPNSSSFNSRWESLLSRRSCLSISLCILSLSASWAERQHSSMVCTGAALSFKLRHSCRGLVLMDNDFSRTCWGNFCPGTGGLATFSSHSSSCRIQFRCIPHSCCAREAGLWERKKKGNVSSRQLCRQLLWICLQGPHSHG